jgi:hypothetical protein
VAEVYGGPYDGARPSCSIPSEFLYTDGSRSYRTPGRGRVLVRRWNRHGGGILLMYAEYAYLQCSGCLAFHARGTYAQRCALCGSELVPPAAARQKAN